MTNTAYEIRLAFAASAPCARRCAEFLLKDEFVIITMRIRHDVKRRLHPACYLSSSIENPSNFVH